MPTKPPAFTFSTVVALIGFGIAVATNLLTELTQNFLCFLGMMVVLCFVVVGSDYYDRFAKYWSEGSAWRADETERRRLHTLRTRTHYERVRPILRTILRLIERHWSGANITLEFIIYRKGKYLGKDAWIPVAEWKGRDKYAFSFPFDDVWFQQAIRMNQCIVTRIDNSMLQRLSDESQHSAFENTKLALVAPISRVRNGGLRSDTIGMLVAYSSFFTRETVSALNNVRSDTEQVNNRISIVLSYDSMCDDED